MAEPLPHAQHDGPHASHVPRYLAVWGALLVLSIGTWAIARIHIPGAGAVAVAVAIAITKGALVALFFMHLYDQPGANRVVFVTSLVFVVLLVGLTVLDNATRFPLANPPGSARAAPPPDFEPAPFERPR